VPRSLKDFRLESGVYQYTSADGCVAQFETAEALIAEGLFEWCGCGQPWAALDYVRLRLEDIAEEGPEHVRELNSPEWHAFWEKRSERRTKLFPLPGSDYFFWYWADDLGLTEHGGGVGGAWMTDYGREVLGLLREWKALAEAEAAGEPH
jgi:hypothetical protein